MAVWSAMTTGARAASVSAGAVVLAAVGYFGLWPSPAVPVEPVAAVEVAAAEVVAAEVAAVEVAAVEVVPEVVAEGVAEVVAEGVAEVVAEGAAEVAVPEAAVAAPAFDLVRVEADGSATVAGSARAGAAVSLRVDGVEVANVTADGAGKFAALFTLAPSEVPRLMSLVMTDQNGAEVLAPDTVALAPIAAPVAVAVAAPVVVAEAEAAPAVPLAPAAILLTGEGAALLQPGAEVPVEVQANVSIETIAYTPEGAVQLAGRGMAAAYLRLYLDAAEISTLQIGPDGLWAVTLADIAPGIYTLRADQLDAAGKVLSRFETPFKRETAAALAAAAAVPEVVAEGVVEAPVVEAPAVAEAVVEAPVVAEAVVEAPAVAEAVVEAPAVEAPAVAEVAVEAPVVAEVAADAPVAPVVLAPVSVTVQPGFTLWRIAREQFGDGVMYVQVFEANKDKIRDPDLIYPGQVFTIPKGK